MTFPIGMLLLFATACGPRDPGMEISARQPVLPILAKKERNQALHFTRVGTDSLGGDRIGSFEFTLEGSSDLADIAKAEVYYNLENDFGGATLLGATSRVASTFTIVPNRPISMGKKHFWLSLALRGRPELTHLIQVGLLGAETLEGTGVKIINHPDSRPQRLGLALKQTGEEGIDTYRIPGLATTNKGTLIAVYDNRYNDPVDLQEDVDVGMSRSTDGGQSWEPMKVIMDMGQYGGLPENQNGIGDPAVLVDKRTNTIWVAALWLHGYPGERAWNASRAGMSPQETGQLMLVKSEDDGLNWSEPINITAQTKKPEWQLFFNGPGNGISMADGTLVFAAQYKDRDRVPHSTLIYSTDGGKGWEVGTGAKSETTEAQLVELSDGVLMLNMRDDRNRPGRKDSLNGRSVAISRDLGRTWTEHPSSRKALIEPNCMASIIAHDDPDKGRILFFSNPNSRTDRNHITIKTSFDLGESWPVEHQIELYADPTYGYSALSMIDEDHLGILYEGVRELYFQKIPLADLFGP